MIKNGKREAIVRTVVFAILMINQILTSMGWNPLPFSDEQIFEGVTAVSFVVVALWTWWFNNNLTDEAIEGQKKLEELKGAKK